MTVKKYASSYRRGSLRVVFFFMWLFLITLPCPNYLHFTTVQGTPRNSPYYMKFRIVTGYVVGKKDYLTKVAVVPETLIWSMKV